MPLRPYQHAFTLVELSIVLVVIGLIVGGVLVGKDLIHAAEIRATISQIEGYQSAVNTFRTKYRFLPGDLPNAASYGLTPAPEYAGSCKGDGELNEYFCSNTTAANASGEIAAFWTQLSVDTHLINGAYIAANPFVVGETIPILKIGGGVVASRDGLGHNWYGTGVANIAGQTYTANPAAISPPDAFLIDKKMDDGQPNTGSVRISMIYNGGGNNMVSTPNAAYPSNCAWDGSAVNTPAAVYRVQNDFVACNLRFAFQ